MYRPYVLNQPTLFPQDVREYLGPTHEASLICEAIGVVREVDSFLRDRFSVGQSGEGRPAFDPIMMLSLLCYGYAIGVRSSRKMARLPVRDMGAYWLTAGERPDFRTICLFRVQNEEALATTFAHVLKVAKELGLLNLGVLALDGTRMRANVKRSMSTVKELEEQLEIYREKIREILREVEENDRKEDERFGTESDGTELPEEIQSEEARKQKLKEIADRLRNERKREKSKKLLRAIRMTERFEKARAVAWGWPERKLASGTDPDARLMKLEGGKIQPGYNAQAIVEQGSQIIVGGIVLNDSNDSYAALPALSDVMAHQGEEALTGRDLVADRGYFNSANIETFVNIPANCLIKPIGEGNRQYVLEPQDKKPKRLSKWDFRFHDRGEPEDSFYICPKGRHLTYVGQERLDSGSKRIRYAQRRQGHLYRSKNCEDCTFAPQCLPPDGRPRALLRDPIADPFKDRMHVLFRKPEIQRTYIARMYTAEPVFAMVKEHRGMRRFLLRGLKNVNIEWRLACLTHNLLRIARTKIGSPTPLPVLT